MCNCCQTKVRIEHQTTWVTRHGLTHKKASLFRTWSKQNTSPLLLVIIVFLTFVSNNLFIFLGLWLLKHPLTCTHRHKHLYLNRCIAKVCCKTWHGAKLRGSLWNRKLVLDVPSTTLAQRTRQTSRHNVRAQLKMKHFHLVSLNFDDPWSKLTHHLAKYVGQRWPNSKLIVQTHTPERMLCLEH